MNESILEEIFYDNCGLLVKMQYTKEYDRLKHRAEGYYDKLFAILGKEPSEWLDEIFLTEAGMESEFGLMCFREGVRFVFRLFADIMQNEGGNKKSPLSETEGGK